jgi:hypothetical protein
MPKGGKRPGAGRKPGSRNKRTQAIADGIAETGETPLEFMLRVMRDPAVDFPTRADMAKAAAPYVHARLASTELKGDGGGPLIVEILRFTDDQDVLPVIDGECRRISGPT